MRIDHSCPVDDSENVCQIKITAYVSRVDQTEQQDAQQHAVVLKMDGIDENETRMQEQRRRSDSSRSISCSGVSDGKTLV